VLVPHLLRIGPRRLERLVLALLGALTIWLGYRSFPARLDAVPGTDEAQEVSAILPAPGIELGAPSFDGVFDGRMTDRTGSRPVRAILWRQGERVTGTYRGGLEQGDIAGVVEGDTLVFSWQSAAGHGHGRVRAGPGGVEFEGTWGFGEAATGGGVWAGARVGR
jgi:hypothetical protein